MKRGEVVIIEYPFSDGSGTKRRPALIVFSDAVQSPDTIIAAISASAAETDTRVPITPGTDPGSHLQQPCVVRCDNLMTIARSSIYGAVGRLTTTTMRKVDQALKTSLGLR